MAEAKQVAPLPGVVVRMPRASPAKPTAPKTPAKRPSVDGHVHGRELKRFYIPGGPP
jgi:hypothetical protein